MTKPAAAPPCAVCLGDPCLRPREHARLLSAIRLGEVGCSSSFHVARNGRRVIARYYTATAGPLCEACWLEWFGRGN